MKFFFMRSFMLILSLGISSACSLPVKPRLLGFLYGYDSVLRDYKAGRIMEARNTVLHMDKSRPDYAAARVLLKKKIDPARLRLLRHYVHAAQQAEKVGIWFKAKALYEQAASFSISNAALLRKARILDLRMRQIRMDTLITQRRKEDSQLLHALNQYNAPKSLSPKDEPFARQRERLGNQVMSRARSAWLAAKRELRQGYPEAAYVEIESFRRLRPEAPRGKALMSDIRKKLPKGLHIPSDRQATHIIRHDTISKIVTASAIRNFIRKGAWLKAKRYAISYQRQNGEQAERFLKSIEKNMDEQAVAAFRAGRIAFRTEHLDKAVKYWRRAVALRPDNAEYVRSLNRALQLQERLRILRSETDAPKP